MTTYPLEPRPGDKILPFWRRLMQAIRAMTLIAGEGVRLQRTVLGTVVSVDVQGAGFAHPFRPALTGEGGVTIAPGRVAGREPVIDGTPLSGEGERPVRPVLKLERPSEEGDESWVVIRVTRAPEPEPGETAERDGMEILHVEKVERESDQEIALVVWAGERPERVLPIVMHHLNYGWSGERVHFWAV